MSTIVPGTPNISHTDLPSLVRDLFQVLAEHAHAINDKALPSYTVAGAPPAASHDAELIFVSNETGGATVAFSDGTNWRRVQDRAIIS